MKYDKYNNVLSYRFGQIKNNGTWNTIIRITRYARRYIFISRLIRYTSAVIAFIETSAILVIALTVILAALPFLAVSFLFTVLFSISKQKKYNPIIEKETEEADKIVFIDAPKGFYRKKAAYLNRMAETFHTEGYTVFVISHSYVTDRFTTARKAADGIWVIKLSYYFIIKKRFLKGKEDKLTYIF